MIAAPIGDNLLRPFQLERSALRGRLVRLGGLVDRVLTGHDYPEPVSRLLGELLVLAATLAGGLKFRGTFSLQVKATGPVSLMIADCTNDGAMRGFAKFDAGGVAVAAGGGVPDLLGEGHLALTVDQSEAGQTYQGIVELSGATLTECMQTYFRQSEQVKTGIEVAVGRVVVHRVGDRDQQRWRAGGIMVQRLPEQVAEGREDEMEEDWRRTMLLLGSATEAELVDPHLAPERLLLRLFHEEGVRVFRPLDLSFGCRCSRARVEAMLRRFPPAELDDMKEADGHLVVTCEFCSATYRFDEAELAALHGGLRH
jgi:molecular chaperone Hsp33